MLVKKIKKIIISRNILSFYKKRKKSASPSSLRSSPISDSDSSLSIFPPVNPNQPAEESHDIMNIDSIDNYISSTPVQMTLGTHSVSSFFQNKRKPCQPLLKSYPGRKMGSKVRRFNKDWYAQYKWLEYNEDLDAWFCFACRMFLPTSPETSFTSSGFLDWKHAKGKGTETNSKDKIKEKKKGLDQHASCHSHKEAMVLWADSENVPYNAPLFNTLPPRSQQTSNNGCSQYLTCLVT